MKRLSIILAALLLALPAPAQFIGWSVKPVYSQVQPMSEQWARVQRDGKWGIANLEGKEVVPCQYGTITDFAAGYCLLLDRERLLGVFSREGNLRTFSDPLFVDGAYPYFSEGLLAVRDVESSWTYMTPEGTYPIRMVFQSAAPFIQGLAAVQEKGGDGSYLHIDKKGHVNRLGGDFTDTFLVFASSFTQVDGQNVALVVDGHNEAWFRDFSGRKVFGLGKVTGYDKAMRVMTMSKYRIHFSADRRVMSRVSNADKSEKVFFEERDRRYLPPTLTSLTFSEDSHGKWEISKQGNLLLSPQFDALTALSETRIAASLDGLWGFLQVREGEDEPYCGVQEKRLDYSHPADFRFTGVLNIPDDIPLQEVRIQLWDESGKQTRIVPSGRIFTTNLISPPNPEKEEIEFYTKVIIGSLVYPAWRATSPAIYLYPYFVECPKAQKMLSGNERAGLSFTVENRAGSASNPCDVYVNGNLVKQGVVFDPGETKSFSCALNVSLEDLDRVQREVRIVIVEEGMTRSGDFYTPKTVVFERNFN